MTALTSNIPLRITTTALEELKHLLTHGNLPADHALRVGVKGGGCSGYSYMLGFDKAQPGDELFEIEGIRVLMHPAHGMYLAGMEIDYHEGLENRGFVFNNPNASETCGCGQSFA